jgi:hypothetical protein
LKGVPTRGFPTSLKIFDIAEFKEPRNICADECFLHDGPGRPFNANFPSGWENAIPTIIGLCDKVGNRKKLVACPFPDSLTINNQLSHPRFLSFN